MPVTLLTEMTVMQQEQIRFVKKPEKYQHRYGLLEEELETSVIDTGCDEDGAEDENNGHNVAIGDSATNTK
jgi:hypothetical protein